jgi:hypothetical protein
MNMIEHQATGLRTHCPILVVIGNRAERDTMLPVGALVRLAPALWITLRLHDRKWTEN